MSKVPHAQVVLLAAGSSKRFNGDKRKALMPSGATIWQSSLRLYSACGLSGLVVVKNNEQEYFAERLPDSFEAIECANANEGMWASRAYAISKLTSDYAIIALADMPFIQPKTIQALLHMLGTGSIIQPTFNSQAGHPKIFHRSLFSQLSGCTSSQEAKALISKNNDSLVNVNVDDAGILRDIDYRADIPENFVV
ncbi:MAG: NTP transferase domain-containing protein [Pseudomonadales bacterium]